jgi:FAD/FMN-containing dehydrogenase
MASGGTIASFPTLTPTAEVIFSTEGQISRWSNLGISANGCAAIVVPSTEEDIISVIKFAAQSDLKVLPTGGKHGTILPIDERSIYLDLEKFDTVALDEEAGQVTIGGGVVTGRMCKALAEKGWYTSKLSST